MARIEGGSPDLRDVYTWSAGYRPVGVAVDRQGRVYTPDADRRTVDVFAPGGEHLTALNVNTQGSELDSPTQLAMSSDGTTLFVLGNNGLLKLTLETVAPAPAHSPPPVGP